MSPEIDLSPTGGVMLPDEPAERVEAFSAALDGGDPKAALEDVVSYYPDFVAAWAALGDMAFEAGATIEAYAYYRVGYHRALDSLRKNGWRGAGRVPFDHEPNQGFHRATFGLMRTSDAIGDTIEAERCRQLLLDSDPRDPLGAAS